MNFHLKYNNRIFLSVSTTCRYFMDKELLDRVPSLFLLLSAIWASMQIIGIGFMREPTEDELSQLIKLSESGSKNLEANVDKSVKASKPYSVLPSQARKLSVFWRLWIIRVRLSVVSLVTSHYSPCISLCSYKNDTCFKPDHHGNVLVLLLPIRQELRHALHIRRRLPGESSRPAEHHERLLEDSFRLPFRQVGF